jgi:hypothetical protein
MVDNKAELQKMSSPKRVSILPRLWHNQRVMAPVLARLTLMVAAVAALLACFLQGAGATLLGVLAAGLFPAGLMLLAEDRESALPRWIALLAVSLMAGLSVALFWRGSPVVQGLPLATWLTWLLLGAIPFVLVVFGVVVRRSDA